MTTIVIDDKTIDAKKMVQIVFSGDNFSFQTFDEVFCQA